MKYIKLFEDFDPYELMMITPQKKTQMIIDELASGKPDLTLVKTLITMGAELDWKDEDGWTVLNYSVSFGNIGFCKILLEAGANPNMKDNRGFTALHYASKDRRILNSNNFLKILIDAGAEVNIKDNNWTWTPLMYTLHQDNIEGIEFLLKNGADPNIQSDNGNTSLHWAVLFYYKSPEAIKRLLDAGADPMIKNEDGKTPLELAKENKDPELIHIFDNY